MTWKNEYSSLYKRLKAAVGGVNISEVALDKRITREAKGITPAEALFVLAFKNGVSFTREFNRLPIEAQGRVSQAISLIKAGAASLSRPVKKQGQDKNVQLVLRTPLGQIRDPYLAGRILKEATDMSVNAYPYLYVLENSMRNFITLVLEMKYGKDWWNNKITGTNALSTIASKATDRTAKEEWNSYHSRRGAHPIYYVDYDDLIALFRAFERDFNPYFKNLGGKLGGMLNKLEEITPSRNVVAHHNPLSRRDNARVFGYLHDWLGQLDYIKKSNLL